MSHSKWMVQALNLARQAYDIDEVPVGACVVLDNEVIGTGYNSSIIDCNPCAHAEILALQNAGANLGNYRLLDATLYCTLEPCAMCAMALVHARIKHLVFGALDVKTGAIISTDRLLGKEYINHRIQIDSGILAEECGAILTDFFASKRQQKREIS